MDARILICDQDLGTSQEHRIFELRISADGEAARDFTNQYRLVA